MRLDLYLFTKGYVKSRQKAKSLIESSSISIDGKIVAKPSYEVHEENEYTIELKDDCAYVSRGGLKLEAILTYANIDLKDKICLDIGASTGGFTDCLLKNGAKLVYAVDSGSLQLDETLKIDK